MSEPRPKPKRKIRIDQRRAQEVHDDGHSWAVSYADFLMVLLSFFILFFSVDANKRKDIINDIKLSAEGKGEGASTTTAPTASLRPQVPKAVSDIVTKMDGFYVERENKSQKLFIYFNDNIYRPGGVDLPSVEVSKLKFILTQLDPFLKDINITFVGHTDSTAVIRNKSKLLNDNFALSSFRATKALQLAVAAGFSPTAMFATGAGEYSRGSRTLSLVISPREED